MESSKAATFCEKMKHFFMSKIMFIIYGVFFLLVIPGIALFAKSTIINMENIDKLGSYLSGIGTVVAAAAALYGVNGWIKQLKYGKYLDIIWEAKTNIRKVFLDEMNWYIQKYQGMSVTEVTKTLRDNIEHSEAKLKASHQELLTSFNKIDQIIDKKDFTWANYCSEFKTSWLKIENQLLIPRHKEAKKNIEADIELARLNEIFQNNYYFLLNELEKLENTYSK